MIEIGVTNITIFLSAAAICLTIGLLARTVKEVAEAVREFTDIYRKANEETPFPYYSEEKSLEGDEPNP